MLNKTLALALLECQMVGSGDASDYAKRVVAGFVRSGRPAVSGDIAGISVRTYANSAPSKSGAPASVQEDNAEWPRLLRSTRKRAAV